MSNLTDTVIDQIIEAALFAYGEPLSAAKLQQLFTGINKLTINDVNASLKRMVGYYENRGVQLIRVATGWRFQAIADTAPFLQQLWDKKPKRYSRATLETLVLIAYRQPITRGEIEEVRGVAVNTQIIKSLLGRDWIKVVGTRNVPGRPALFGTTKAFLDYFELTKLSDLPPLEDIHSTDQLSERLAEQLSLLAGGENLPEESQESAPNNDGEVAALSTEREEITSEEAVIDIEHHEQPVESIGDVVVSQKEVGDVEAESVSAEQE